MFIQGIINSENPSADFYEVVAEALTTVGYTLVDTQTFTGLDSNQVSGTRTHKVWESPSATIFGQKWFLDVVYEATGDGPLWFLCFEDFDVATGEAYRGPITYHVGGLFEDGSGGGDTPFPLEDAHWMSPGHPDDNWYLDESYTLAMRADDDMGYWGSITADRVIFMVSHNAGSFVYSGFFKPSPVLEGAAGADLFPLCMGHISVYEYSEDYIAVTRHPINAMGDMDIMAVMSKSKEGGSFFPSRHAGTVKASEMWICSFGGWFGSFYDVAAIPAASDQSSSGADAWYDWTGMGRGDIVSTNTDPDSTSVTAEWVIGAARWANGSSSYALLMKKV